MDEQASVKEPRLMVLADSVATLVMLNLCFLLTSLGIVTILPSAIALQAVLPKPGEPAPDHPARQYFRAFCQAWRNAWPLGMLLPAVTIAGFLAVAFYLAADSVFGMAALLVLVPLLSATLAAYLALLQSSVTWGIATGWREWTRHVPQLLSSRPLQAAGAVLLMGTAAALASKLPTLLPLGCGIVPAYIALWAFGPKRPRTVDDRRLRR